MTSDASIVNAIINLGRALGIQVIAEGVETEAQRQFLRQAGCHEFQGYLFAPALDVTSFEALLAPRRRPPRGAAVAPQRCAHPGRRHGAGLSRLLAKRSPNL